MGMVKEKFTEYEISMDSMKESLEWMTRYGVKTFKDHTGEWVEVRCSRMANFFDSEFEVYPHLTMESV